MKALSSSRLRLVDERCPGALDLAEAGAPYDASLFGTGKVAHACLDALHRASKAAGGAIDYDHAVKVAHATAATMATQGSAFDANPEPPVTLDTMRPGVDLALRHFASEGNAIDPDAHAESGLGVGPDWEPMPYRTATHWRAVLDLVGMREDEDGAAVLWVRDYKSAWPTGIASIQTLQMRGQALVALACAPRLFPSRSPDVVARQVVNLQTGQMFEEALDLADADHILSGWRAEIDAMVEAIPRTPRPFRPGPQCAGCPYRLTCRAAPPEATDAAATARRYAALLAEAEALEPYLRAATAEAPMEVDGHTLGWQQSDKATPTIGAARELAALYSSGPPDPGLVGLVSQVLGVGGVRSAVAALHPDGRAQEQRDALLSRLIRHTKASRWGFQRANDPERKEKV